LSLWRNRAPILDNAYINLYFFNLITIMAVTLEQIKELRETTGVSMMACKKALEESNGDIKAAIDYLRKRGEAKAAERAERTASQGVITSYIHSNGKIGVLLQLGCETDFVAKNEEFVGLAKDIAMQIAAMNPLAIKPEDISNELIEKEKEIWREQLKTEGKKEEMFEKIMIGKEKKFREEASVLKQAYVKNPEVTIDQLVLDMTNKMGEKIEVVRFTRYSL
jgi:elongation factor Ts